MDDLQPDLEGDYAAHLAEMEATAPAFRESRERLRPAFEFRKTLIGARRAAGLTQKGLAERMGRAQPAVARLERAERLPTGGDPLSSRQGARGGVHHQ